MSSSKVAKNTAYLVAAFVGQKILSFVYFTIVARAVGVQGSGKYVIATSFTTIFSIFVDLGLANILVRETARTPERAEKLLANVMGAKVVLAAATIVAVNYAAVLMGYDADVREMIGLASIVMALDSLHLVFYAVMRGQQNLAFEAVGVVTGQVATIVVGSVFYYLKMPLPFLIIALIFGSTWNVLWSWYALARRAHVPVRFEFDKASWVFLWTAAAPFAIAGVFSRVYTYLDSIMLSKLAVDAATATGIYGVAYKLAFAFQFLPMSFAAAVFPAMSDYYVRDREKLSLVYATSFRYLTMAALPIAFGIGSLAVPLLQTIYGEAFVPAAVPLQILMSSLVFAFLYWPAGSLLNACDRQLKNTTAMGVTVVVNAVMNAFLIPLYGAVGAAVAALVGNVTLWAMVTYYASEIVAVKTDAMLRGAMKTFVAASIMGVTVGYAVEVVHVALLIPLGAIEYGLVLYAIGGISREEISVFVSIVLRRGKKLSDIVTV